jgi:hypothetical protein
MTKPLHSAALLLALSALCLSAQAQVYRCGGSYSNTPCPGATIVPTDDARSAAQKAQTDAATKRDAKSAQVLEVERLKQEGKPPPAIILAPVPAAEPPQPVADKPDAKKKKARKPELFTAVAPKKPGETTAKKEKKKKAATV